MSPAARSLRRRAGFYKRIFGVLPDGFPRCVIGAGKIARADGLPLEWEQYDLLGEGFPATLTEDGELQRLGNTKRPGAL